MAMDEAPDYGVMPAHKKFKQGDNSRGITLYKDTTGSSRISTSSLASPTMQLTGHSGSVYALAYSPSGDALCSSSFDKQCLLWSHGQYDNYNTLSGHKNAILDCKWLDDHTVVTASADKTVMLWDALTGSRLRKWQQHEGIVNACDSCTEYTVVSASDDNTCILWDRRQKQIVSTFVSEYPVTAVAASETHIYTGGIDNLVTCWDISTQKKVFSMKGHTDTITYLSLHPEGTHILSNSMDHTLQSWDIRNYVSGKRHCKTFIGHKHNAEKGLLKCSWSRDGRMVTCGSADRMVHIWDEYSEEELYLLPGHKGCVNSVVFHPIENVIASAGSDKHIFVGELS